MKFTILLKSEDDSTAPLIVSKIERTGPLKAVTLGLTLAESKRLLARVQQEIVESQLNGHTEEQRICIRYGSRQTLKDYHSVHFKSLFGSVTVRVARLNVCLREGQHARARTVQIAGLEHWVSPELEFIQSQLAATIPYARTAELLDLLLPIATGNASTTVRRHTLSVGQRLESELQKSVDAGPVERSKTKTDPVTAVGLAITRRAIG